MPTCSDIPIELQIVIRNKRYNISPAPLRVKDSNCAGPVPFLVKMRSCARRGYTPESILSLLGWATDVTQDRWGPRHTTAKPSGAHENPTPTFFSVFTPAIVTFGPRRQLPFFSSSPAYHHTSAVKMGPKPGQKTVLITGYVSRRTQIWLHPCRCGDMKLDCDLR